MEGLVTYKYKHIKSARENFEHAVLSRLYLVKYVLHKQYPLPAKSFVHRSRLLTTLTPFFILTKIKFLSTDTSLTLVDGMCSYLVLWLLIVCR